MTLKIGNITLFDIQELSKKFDLNPVTLRSYIKRGRLKGQKMGTKWYISEDSLKDFFGESYQGSKSAKG